MSRLRFDQHAVALALGATLPALGVALVMLWTGAFSPKVQWTVGELVRVKEGPFTDFNGAVEDVNYEKSKVKVSVTIFGRATGVELDFAQVEKI